MPEPVAYLKMNTSGESALWRRFTRPQQVVQTDRLSQVKAKLAQVEALALTGLHAVGFLSFEAAPAFDSAFPVRETPDFPLLWFGLFQDVQEIEPDSEGEFTVGEWTPSLYRSEYDAGIQRIRDEIAAGNTYQVNYTARLHAPFQGDALAYFRQLAGAQDTNYSAFIDTGEQQILSVSPELFFRVQGRTITTRPMKGTIRRGLTESDDQGQAARLQASEKERAENIMIVDLLRNDLGRVATFGSVQVTELCQVEKYPTLLTMTSTIQAHKREGVTLLDIFTALFPCGSVTGAPKISTMHLIHELEPQARRVYCGAIGLIEPNGDAVFNVPIRTVLIQGGVAEYGAGGGITWDSRAGDEYAELRTKASVLSSKKPEFELLETLRLQDGVAVNADLHLERMASSGRYFDFNFDLTRIGEALAQAAAQTPSGTHRLRVLLGKNGEVTVQTLPLGPNPPTVKARLARFRVNDRTVLLYHKTTQRDLYDRHTSLIPPGMEVLMFNQYRELTEFTTGNVILQLDGQLYTPPVSCGLLPGVERRRAIEEHGVIEQALRLHYVLKAEVIWHVNSLRGWRQVELDRNSLLTSTVL